jgi:predicted tellurium resistance membrane protein TerC
VELLTDPAIWIAFLTLLALELVLGIDNVIFISILASKLPEHQQARARYVGLSVALISRLLLLFAISWVIGLQDTLFSVGGLDFSGKDVILILGGAFLVVKAVLEIHERLEGEEAHAPGATTAATATFGGVIAQVLLLDFVFSLDSVITAVGMVDEIAVMVAAIVIAIGITLALSGQIFRFVERHPSIKMLALSFLVLIGATLIGEGFGYEVPKGYVYGPIAFAVVVELLNLRYKAVRARNAEHSVEPVHLRPAYVKDAAPVEGPEQRTP